MDYTKIPRELIYQDRHSLKEFGIYDNHIINKRIAYYLRNQHFIKLHNNPEESVLYCMNQAYYYCTMAILEDDPCWRIQQYESNAVLFYNTPFKNDYTVAILSMVATYLSMMLNEADGHMCDFVQELHDQYIGYDIFEGINQCLPDKVNLSPDEFAPRPITHKALSEVFSNTDKLHSWRYFTQDYDMERIADVFTAIGNTREEKEAMRESFRWEVHIFCDNTRKSRILAQIDGMDFSSADQIAESGWVTRYSKAIFELSRKDEEILELKRQIANAKSEMKPADEKEYDNEKRDEVNNDDKKLIDIQKNIEELTSEIQHLKAEKENMIVELLMPIFKDIEGKSKEDNIKSFLEEIKDKDGREVTNIVYEWKENNKISKEKCKRPLWQILHAAKYYNKVEQNWTAAIRNHPPVNSELSKR